MQMILLPPKLWFEINGGGLIEGGDQVQRGGGGKESKKAAISSLCGAVNLPSDSLSTDLRSAL